MGDSTLKIVEDVFKISNILQDVFYWYNWKISKKVKGFK